MGIFLYLSILLYTSHLLVWGCLVVVSFVFGWNQVLNFSLFRDFLANFRYIFLLFSETLSCGQSTNDNNTYLMQSDATSANSPCVYKVCPCNNNICRIRYDFMVKIWWKNEPRTFRFCRTQLQLMNFLIQRNKNQNQSIKPHRTSRFDRTRTSSVRSFVRSL